jgi:thermitase
MDRIVKIVATMILAVFLLTSIGLPAYAASIEGRKTGSENAYALAEDSANTTNQLVIGVRNGSSGVSRLAGLVTEFGGKIINQVTIGKEPAAIVVNLPSTSIPLFEREIQAFGLARYFEPNVRFEAQFVPNDPNYTVQWGLQKIEADWAWNTTTGNRSILVAVIDTGIDYAHPDIAANYNASGYDWVNNDADPMDDNGHGTHCAGIIAAVLNNSIGIAGLAQVQIMAEKGLDANGTGYADELASAIGHAVDQGAKILSCSWGGYEDSELIYEAIQYAYARGVLIIAAAGNDATMAKMYPAAYEEVIGVTATDWYDSPATFSNFGNWIELAAPGVGIYSTYLNDSYRYASGTSMACPFVAGVGALVWSQFQNATRDWVRAQLRYTADDLGTLGFDQHYGYGRINARSAVEKAFSGHDLLIFDWERPSSVQPGDFVVFSITVLNFGTDDEHNVTAELFVNSSLQDSRSTNNLPAGESWTTFLSWNPQVEGMFNVTVYVVPVAGETNTANNRMTDMIAVRYMLTLDPSEGSAGTKVNATGVDFSPLSEVMVTFNDAFVGYAVTDAVGNFDFTFNIPFSSAGTQVVKALDVQGNMASSVFAVLDTTPLEVQVDVGNTHFLGETASFYAQTTFEDQAINATTTTITLYKPDNTTENLTRALQPISTGLYRISYVVVGNETGTYTLVMEASYVTDTVQANGTSLKCFLVSDTLTLMNQQVIGLEGGIAKVQTDLGLMKFNLSAINGQVTEIKDGVASVQTDLGLMTLNLTAINATLNDIFLYVKTINGATATIQTTIGTMNVTITSMNGDVATFLVPSVGRIEADVSGFAATRGVWTGLQYAILVAVLISAAGAILSTAMLLRRRKKVEPETKL